MVRIQKINLLFVLLFFVSTFANAQTEVDGVYYKIIDGNTVEVCAVPNIADLTPYSGIIVIPPTVQIGEKQYNVTKIGEKAFENATLTSLSIPSSVKTIGNNAFSGCSKDNFKKVYFADMTHLTTISYASMYSSPIMYAQEVWLTDKNKKVTEITIKNNVNPYAFRGATWLTKVTFEGNNVTIIANDAFYGCTNLTEIELPSELTNIGVAAFRDCTGLTSITIPASATSIGKETFWNCTCLKNLVINAPLTALPNSMFLSCGDLTELTINLENLVEIGEKTFSGCKSLKSFPFKESILEDIQTCSFLECKSLTKIELPTTIKTIGDNAFENCSSLTELTIAEGYSSNLQIGGSTFKSCKLLTSFPFEESQLEVIPASAFEGCGFTTLELPAILRAIRGSAFKDCNNLTTLTIPAPDTDEPLQIGAYAFSNNTNLKYIHSNAQTAPGVATGAENSIFDGNTGIQLYYDKDYDEVYGYDKLPWSDFNPKPFKENTITYYVYKDDRVLHEGPYPQQVGQETPIVKAKPTWGDGWEFEKWIDEIPQYMPESESGLEINGYFTKEYTSTDGVKYRLYSYIPKEARVIGYYNSPKDIVIPSSIQFNEIDYNVVAIEDEAFKGAKSLETVDLSNATTNIGKSIFEDCSALTSVKLPTDLTIIPDNMFSGCSALSTLDIPSKVTKIGVSAFEGCSALEKIMLPAVLTEISERMFYGCSALSTLDIPSNVTKIGASAFEGCTIYNIDHLPSGLQEIGKSAFNSCGIEKMTLPSSITSMGDNVFQSCTKLIEVIFDNEMYLTTLPAYTFSGCSNLKSFTLPTSTRTIGINAFADCISLNYLTLDNIETINSNAFTHCDNLKAITLSIIETLGNLAFSYCGNVKMITIESEKLPVVGESTFADIYSKATLCVKNAENYRKHEIWGKFKNIESIVSSLPKLIYMLDGKEIVEFSNDYKPGTPIEKKGEKLGLSDELSEKYNPQGREFKGWDGEPDVMPNKDVVVNGWLKYQLTYMAEGTESVLASDGFFYDDEIVEPKDQLNKEGFTYKVLDPITKMPANDYILYVKYILNDNNKPKPASNRIIYIAKPQPLITGGSTSFGTFKYSLNNKDFTDDITKIVKEDAGTYPVYYKVEGVVPGYDTAVEWKNVDIERREVSNPVIILDPTYPLTYDGDKKEPPVTLKWKDNNGEEHDIYADEYNYSYDNNTNAGNNTAKVTITDKTDKEKGNYIVNGSKSFTITKASIDIEKGKDLFETPPSKIDNLVFNGTAEAFAGTAQALINAGTLNDPEIGTLEYSLTQNEKDFSSEIPTGTDAKTYSVLYRVRGNDNYNNSAIIKDPISVTIAPKELTSDDLEITLTPASYTYDGGEKKPSVTVKYGETAFTDKDFSYRYANHINVGTEEAQPTVIIEDKDGGNYDISGSQTFTISPAASSLTITPTAKANTYDGTDQALINGGASNTGKVQYSLSKEENSFSETIPTGKNAGDYTVYYRVKGDANHSDSEIGSVKATIAAKEITSFSLSQSSYTYAGSEIKPDVIVEFNKQAVSKDEYTVSYSDNKNVGTATVTVTDKEGGNFTVSGSKTFTIAKAPLTISADSYDIFEGDKIPEFTIKYDGFVNNETEAVLTAKPIVSCNATATSKPGDYTISVGGSKAANYNITHKSGKLTIIAMKFVSGGESSKDEDDAATYQIISTGNDTGKTPTVAITDDKEVGGAFAIPETVTYHNKNFTVTEINESAFENNKYLTEVSIPSSITSIGDKAFKGCSNLKSITVYITTPISLAVAGTRGEETSSDGTSVFDGVDKTTCILYVPEASVDLYKAAPVWKDFQNILPITETTGISVVNVTEGEPFDVYNLQGRKVKARATDLRGLPRGIYIINGKKVAVK